LFESRRAILKAAAANPLLKVSAPQGALYAFMGVDTARVPDFDDQAFALELLERKHVLVAPGVSFNVPYRDHFRVTNLPDAATLATVFGRVNELLTEMAERPRPAGSSVVSAAERFRN
jgi:alanine-synthesizing transaminase